MRGFVVRDFIHIQIHNTNRKLIYACNNQKTQTVKFIREGMERALTENVRSKFNNRPDHS